MELIDRDKGVVMYFAATSGWPVLFYGVDSRRRPGEINPNQIRRVIDDPRAQG